MSDLEPYTVEQPGGPYILSRQLTRHEMLDALARCQNGDASCLYTLKLFEAHIELVCTELLNSARNSVDK